MFVNWARTHLLNEPASYFRNVACSEYVPYEYIKVTTDSYVEGMRNLFFLNMNAEEKNKAANKLLSLVNIISQGKLLVPVDNSLITYNYSTWSTGTTDLVVETINNGCDILLPRVVNLIPKTKNAELYQMLVNAPSSLHKLAYYVLIVIYLTDYYRTKLEGQIQVN